MDQAYEIDCHFVCEKVAQGIVKLLPVRSHDQLADVFTKALPVSSLTPLLSKMAVINIHSPS